MSYPRRVLHSHWRTCTLIEAPGTVQSSWADTQPDSVRRYRLDLGVLLRTNELPTALRTPMRCGPHGHEGPLPEHFVAPAAAAGIARSLLRALSHGDPGITASHAPLLPATRADVSADEACALISELAARVHQLGWLAPFSGLARPMWINSPQHMLRERLGADTSWPWLPDGDAHRTLRLAWSVCAISHLRPPHIDWTNGPSLDWWRGDEVIELVWPAP